MTAAITTFDFEGTAVRLQDINGESWFVGKDVCGCLQINNHRDALSRLGDDEKDRVGIADAIGRERDTTIINEPGCYQLVFTSRTEASKRFKRWLAHDVLPTLRRSGNFSRPAIGVADLLEPEKERMWERRINLYRMLYGQAGGRWMLEQSPMPSPPGARSKRSVTRTDGPDCLDYLLSVRMDNDSATEMVSDLLVDDPASLKIHGLWVHPPGWDDCVCVANRNPSLTTAFAASSWADGGWTAALGTMSEAVRNVGALRFGPGEEYRSRGVMLPLSVFELAAGDG